MASFIKLEVVAGPDTGAVFEVRDVAIIGRVDQSLPPEERCEVSLNDGQVSTKHARINTMPSATLTDLGSANHTYLNGQQTLGADLNEGDIIEVGATRLRVRFELDAAGGPVRDRAAEKKRKGLLLLAVVGIVAALGLVVFGLKLREQRELENTPLIATKISGKLPYEGRMTVVFPMAKEGDFNIPAAFTDTANMAASSYSKEMRRYKELRAKFEVEYKANLDRVTPADVPPDRYDEVEEREALVRKAMHDELSLARKFPDDPMARKLSYEERNWNVLPPRFGNGRFIWSGGKFVLGDFRGVRFDVLAPGYSNPTPPKLVGPKLYPFTSTNIYIYFAVDCWDSLPPSMNIRFFSLDTPASEDKEKQLEFYDKPLVPRFPNNVIARNKWENDKITDMSQSAVTDLTRKVPKSPAIKESELTEEDLVALPFNRLWVRQKKVGEMLYVATGMCYSWQSDRLDKFVDNMLEAQQFPGRTRTESPEELIKRGLDLERKARLILDTSRMRSNDDYATVSDKAKFWMVFNRYMEALCLLQAADKWRNDKDYDRIYEEARRLYEYFQSDSTYFRKRYNDIQENLRQADRTTLVVERKRLLEDALKKVDELWKLTLGGQEPDRYPLDEWFIYAHLTRHRLKKELEE